MFSSSVFLLCFPIENAKMSVDFISLQKKFFGKDCSLNLIPAD